MLWAMPLFRLIVSGLWKPGFDPRACEIFGGRSGLALGQVFNPVVRLFFVGILTPMLSTPLINSSIHSFVLPLTVPLNKFLVSPHSSLTVGSFFVFSQICGINPRIKMYHFGPSMGRRNKIVRQLSQVFESKHVRGLPQVLFHYIEL